MRYSGAVVRMDLLCCLLIVASSLTFLVVLVISVGLVVPCVVAVFEAVALWLFCLLTSRVGDYHVL